MLGFFWKRKKVHLNHDVVENRRRRVSPMADTRMSKHARISCVTAIIDDQPDWDYALDSEKALENAMEAAAYFGYRDPLNPEQKALCNFLVKNFAGQKISMYAWGVYADICGPKEAPLPAMTQ